MDLSEIARVDFTSADLFGILVALPSDALDALPFGVIGFDAHEKICLYNAPESSWAGLDKAQVIGSPMFEIVAPCMNNYLIAERFVQAKENAEALDVVLDYVLTLRMRPTPCALRLLADPGSPIRFVLLTRK